MKKSGAVAFHAEAATDDRLLHRRGTVADTCQVLVHTVNTNDKEVKPESFSNPAATNKDDVSTKFSAHEIDTGRDGCQTVGSTQILEQVVSSRLNFRDNHRGLLVERCLPEKNPDPLSTFMMLRAQQTASVGATPQNMARTPGRLMVLLSSIRLIDYSNIVLQREHIVSKSLFRYKLGETLLKGWRHLVGFSSLSFISAVFLC